MIARNEWRARANGLLTIVIIKQIMIAKIVDDERTRSRENREKNVGYIFTGRGVFRGAIVEMLNFCLLRF